MTNQLGVPAFVLLIAALALAFLLSRLLRLLAQFRRIQRIPVSTVALLPGSGQAAVTGNASGAQLSSPFAAIPCVFWSIEVQEYRSNGRSGSWRTVLARTSDAPLVLDDGTGRVQIEPAGAALFLQDRFAAQQGMFGGLNQNTLDALERLGVRTRTWLSTSRRLRIRERQIRHGERVFALGEIARASAQAALASTPDAPLLLSDRDAPALARDLTMRMLGLLALPLLLLLAALLIGVFG
jgi:hypothetical protein